MLLYNPILDNRKMTLIATRLVFKSHLNVWTIIFKWQSFNATIKIATDKGFKWKNKSYRQKLKNWKTKVVNYWMRHWHKLVVNYEIEKYMGWDSPMLNPAHIFLLLETFFCVPHSFFKENYSRVQDYTLKE